MSAGPLLTLAGFEFRSRLRLISTWVYTLIFFALAMLWMAAAGSLFKDANISFGSGKVLINSPYALAQTLTVLGMLGTSVIAAIMGRAVQQDFEHRSHAFFFTAPISKLQYLGGRYLGALATVLLILAGIGLGTLCGTLLPGLDAERTGSNHLRAYLAPYATVLIPNAVLIGSIFFSLAALTRRMLPVYIGSVLVLLAWMVGQQLLRDIDNKTLASLLDPFGSRAMAVLTQYWTVDERNTLLVPLSGPLLWNRLLWLGVALAISAGCAWRFSFAVFAAERVGQPKKARAATTVTAPIPPAPPLQTLQPVGLRALPHLVGLALRETLKNIYFSVLVLAGMLFVVLASSTIGEMLGTKTWPRTFLMVELLGNSFNLFMVAIIAFYGGELVWREREARIDQIVDALPTPGWLPYLAKLLALMAIPLLLEAALMLCGIGIQLSQGFTRIELPIYLQALFGIQLIEAWFFCALAITVHSVVNQKYLGHFLMIVFYLLTSFSSALGIEDNLLKFGSVPAAVYSDINRWGHFLPRVRAFQLYWAAASLLLLMIGHAMWTRGTASSWRERRQQAALRWSRRSLALSGAALLAFAASGGVIFYNTHVLNPYRTEASRMAQQADYEKRFKARLTAQPQLKITAVRVNVSLYPSRQAVRVVGRFELQNKHSVPVTSLNLQLRQGDAWQVHRMEVPGGATLAEGDEPVAGQLNLRLYQLAQAVAPGASTTLDFDLEQTTPGFLNEGSNTRIVHNGSFINGRMLLPTIGYNEEIEIERNQDRRKFGLEPKERALPRDSTRGLAQNPISLDGDWIRFDATVSTEADQIAIAPGYLQREWTEAGPQGLRRYFRYQMDTPILNFFAFQSARYTVAKDSWAGPNGPVPIEIYHQKEHDRNLASMISSTKASLSYFSRNFSPYQYKQFRIVEFPRDEAFAQSFPNTIPYSELIGFIARVRPDDPKDIDYPYYVTAHEAAHQWWGHQVVGAQVQGGTMLIETLAQYSALMVMKQTFGADKMRRFLRHELEHYLLGRATEQKKELPLARVENQTNIHYAKGSLVMYELADVIGEDRVNEALRAFIARHAFQGPPYPSTLDVLAEFRRVTPPEYQGFIDDLFERITLYENRALSASAKVRPDGKFDITVKVLAHKRVADDLGKEAPAALNDPIDIGVLDELDEPIAIERHTLTTEASSWSFTVDRKPGSAGIDPLNKLIDRLPKDYLPLLWP